MKKSNELNSCDSPLINLEVINVIKITIKTGKGTTDNPTRYITEFWGIDGKKLFVYDPISS